MRLCIALSHQSNRRKWDLIFQSFGMINSLSTSFAPVYVFAEHISYLKYVCSCDKVSLFCSYFVLRHGEIGVEKLKSAVITMDLSLDDCAERKATS